MNFAPYPIRIFCDRFNRQNTVDLNRGSANAEFFRGDDIRIDIGIGSNNVLDLPPLANITSVTAQLFLSENDTNAPMMAATVLAAAMTLGLTQMQWTNGTGSAAGTASHACFTFPGSATSVDLGGAASANYWLRITLLTADGTPKTITLLDGPITVKDGPVTELSPPPLAGARFFTVNGNLEVQIIDRNTGLYHTLTCYSDAGVMTLQLSDTGY